MKYFVIAFLALIAVVAADDTYTTKYDGIDLDEILQSDRLFKNYFNCLMEQGKCTPDGRELKTHIGEALKTECAKCSEKQKKGTEKVLTYIIKNKPEEWKQLQAKYDPEGVYTAKYRTEAEKRGLDV